MSVGTILVVIYFFWKWTTDARIKQAQALADAKQQAQWDLQYEVSKAAEQERASWYR